MIEELDGPRLRVVVVDGRAAEDHEPAKLAPVEDLAVLRARRKIRDLKDQLRQLRGDRSAPG